MILQRNNNLISNICKVYVKSIHGNAFPELTEVYTSVSEIKWRSDSSITDAGVLYRNRLDLSYKGLSKDIFSELDVLLNGHYQVLVNTNYGDFYKISSKENPMIAKNRFSDSESNITFENQNFREIEHISQDAASDYGFAYTLNFNLS